MLPFTEAVDSRQRDPDELEASALAWVVRRHQGLAPLEQSALARWLAAAPRHRELFDEFSGVWAIMQGYAPLPPVPGEAVPGPRTRLSPANERKAARRKRATGRETGFPVGLGACSQAGRTSPRGPRV